jgi:hypothetical protein
MVWIVGVGWVGGIGAWAAVKLKANETKREEKVSNNLGRRGTPGILGL